MLDWIQRLLGNDRSMNFGSMDAGNAGLLNPPPEGMNFSNPPDEMTGGWKLDPSQYVDPGLVAAPPGETGGILDRGFLEMAMDQGRKNWEKRGSPEYEFQLDHMNQEAPSLPAMADIMGYVNRSKNQRRERPAARVNSYEYLKGLLG
jgi:hypothetical protein